jgi:hypothetical protein
MATRQTLAILIVASSDLCASQAREPDSQRQAGSVGQQGYENFHSFGGARGGARGGGRGGRR